MLNIELSLNVSFEYIFSVHIRSRRSGGGHRGWRDAHQQGLLAEVHPQPPVHRRHRREEPPAESSGKAVQGKFKQIYLVC